MLAGLCYLHGHAGRRRMNMLVADIGGTQSRFFMFSCEDKEISIKEGKTLSSVHTSFEGLLEEVLTTWPEGGAPLDSVSLLVFAAAGPVRDGRIFMTNASFTVDPSVAGRFFPKARCLVMNDFEAQAWACLTPVMREAVSVLPGRFPSVSAPEGDFSTLSGLARDTSPVVVTGAGTGLGAAWLVPGQNAGAAPFVLASEAGHMAFPFEGREEQDFAAFLADRRGVEPVTAEHVLSGSGLALLYEFCTGQRREPADFTRDPDFASSPCCGLFARFYGRFCRMTALALLPQALVVTGGVAGRTQALVRHVGFAHEFFRAVGSQKAFLQELPVWLNAHPQAGLWGAARAGSVRLQDLS